MKYSKYSEYIFKYIYINKVSLLSLKVFYHLLILINLIIKLTFPRYLCTLVYLCKICLSGISIPDLPIYKSWTQWKVGCPGSWVVSRGSHSPGKVRRN